MTAVSFWPIFAAGIANMIIGFVWYHPKVFGTAWMRMSVITPEIAEKAKRRLPLNTGFALIAGMIAAYVINYFGIAWNVYDVSDAMLLGFVCWIGFVLPTSLGSLLWEQKPVSLWLINSGYWLVSFIVMAMVLLL